MGRSLFNRDGRDKSSANDGQMIELSRSRIRKNEVMQANRELPEYGHADDG